MINPNPLHVPKPEPTHPSYTVRRLMAVSKMQSTGLMYFFEFNPEGEVVGELGWYMIGMCNNWKCEASEPQFTSTRQWDYRTYCATFELQSPAVAANSRITGQPSYS